MARPSTLGYEPALDGLRAAAVLAVLFFHSGLSWAKGGFLGVDAFFVLSGFLISALLLREWEKTGTIRLADFWWRRARRLFPALVLVLAAVALYAAVLAEPHELSQIRDDGSATVLYLANWHFIGTGHSYFEQFATPSPFRHCWSLAIEEQFYVIWPLIAFGALRLGGKTQALLVILASALGAASATSMIVLFDPRADVSRVYYGTDTRAQALLVGALLAMLWTAHPIVTGRPARALLHGAALVSACALGWFWCFATGNAAWLYRGGFLGHAVLVGIVIMSAMQPSRGPIGRALSCAPLPSLGKISYGVYLWHWPVFVALSPTRFDLPTPLLFALRMGATLLLAVGSYVLVEKPVRDGVWKSWRAKLGLFATAAVSVEALYVLALAAPQPSAAPAAVSAPAAAPRPPWGSGKPAAGDAIRVLLVGDSVASSLAPGLLRAGAERGFLLWNATLPGCGLGSDYGERWMGTWVGPDMRCIHGWRERWKELVEAGRPDVVVLLTGAQDTYDRRLEQVVTRFDEPAGATLLKAELEEAIAVLGNHGAAVVLLTSPHYRLGWPQTLVVDRSYLNPAWVDRFNQVVVEVTEASRGRASAIDLCRVLQPDGPFTAEVAGVRVRTKDRVHLTPAGADLAAAAITPHLLAAGRAARARAEQLLAEPIEGAETGR